MPLGPSGTSLGPSQGPDFGEQSYFFNQLSYGLGLAMKSLWHTKWKETFKVFRSLFVFSIDAPKQNATSLLTPVSSIVFYALSSGTLGFALHGSSVNHYLIWWKA